MKTLVESTVPPRSSATGRRAAVKTLGCKINVYESNIISQRLTRDHWTMVDPSQEADLYVINSCTVTREADRQTRQEIRRVLRRNPSAKVVVTGCYAQLAPNELTEIDGVDLVVGNDAKFNIAEILRTSQVSDLRDQADKYSGYALGDSSCAAPALMLLPAFAFSIVFAPSRFSNLPRSFSREDSESPPSAFMRRSTAALTCRRIWGKAPLRYC